MPLTVGTPSLELKSMPQISRCEPTWRFDLRLDDFDLWCVLAGHGTMRCDEQSHALTPGTCLLAGPGMMLHARQERDNPLHVFHCHFESTCSLTTPWSCQVKSHAALEQLCNLCVLSGMRHVRTHTCASVVVLLQWLTLEAELIEVAAATPIDESIEQVITAIRQYPGKNWSLDQLACRAALSTAQFTRRFRRQTGTSPTDYLINQRIERAEHLLRSSSMTVKEIASALGYSNTSYFSRQFKQRRSVYPTDFRNRKTNDINIHNR